MVGCSTAGIGWIKPKPRLPRVSAKEGLTENAKIRDAKEGVKRAYQQLKNPNDSHDGHVSNACSALITNDERKN